MRPATQFISKLNVSVCLWRARLNWGKPKQGEAEVEPCNGYFSLTRFSIELAAKARGLLQPHVLLLLCSGGQLWAHTAARKTWVAEREKKNLQHDAKSLGVRKPQSAPRVKVENSEDARIAWSSERRAAAATHAFSNLPHSPTMEGRLPCASRNVLVQRGNWSSTRSPALTFVTKNTTLTSREDSGTTALFRPLDNLANKKGQQQVSRR